MPRDGSNIYHYPTGIEGEPNQTIQSAPYNSFLSDVEQDLNVPRPILAGGTGASNAEEARNNISAEVSMATVTNYDSHAWQAGSFVSAPGATGSPVPGSWMMGTFVGDINQSIILAYDIGNTSTFYPAYSRQRTGGIWQAWQFVGGNQVNADGDTMTGNLTISKQSPALILNKTDNVGPCLLQGRHANIVRWEVSLGTVAAESNPANGSDFGIFAYDNAGAFRSAPLSINRNTGYATFTGDITINKPVPELNLSKTLTGGNSTIVGKTDTRARWRIDLGNTTAESGGDAGSDFAISRYNDGGFLLDIPLAIQRSTGNITAARPVGFGATAGSFPGNGNTNVGVTIDPSGIIASSHNSIQSLLLNNNSVGWVASFQKSGVTVGSISVTGSATAFNTSSDQRLKEDLKAFDAGVIIDNTKVYDFKWKATHERSYGVLGQQANDVYPQAVSYNKKDDTWGVDYSKYVPILLQEIKALRARVKELEAR